MLLRFRNLFWEEHCPPNSTKRAYIHNLVLVRQISGGYSATEPFERKKGQQLGRPLPHLHCTNEGLEDALSVKTTLFGELRLTRGLRGVRPVQAFLSVCQSQEFLFQAEMLFAGFR